MNGTLHLLACIDPLVVLQCNDLVSMQCEIIHCQDCGMDPLASSIWTMATSTALVLRGGTNLLPIGKGRTRYLGFAHTRINHCRDGEALYSAHTFVLRVEPGWAVEALSKAIHIQGGPQETTANPAISSPSSILSVKAEGNGWSALVSINVDDVFGGCFVVNVPGLERLLDEGDRVLTFSESPAGFWNKTAFHYATDACRIHNSKPTDAYTRRRQLPQEHASAAAGAPEALATALAAAGSADRLGHSTAATPLMYALLVWLTLGVPERWAEVVDQLVAAKANPNTNDLNGLAPLGAAAAIGLGPLVDRLLSAGAIPDLPSENVFTPLYIAALKGHAEVVERLLTAGADPNFPGLHGATPLHAAAARGSVEVVDMLLAAGSDPNARTIELHATPLHVATQFSPLSLSAGILGVGMTLSPGHGLRATNHDADNVVKRLVAMGADVSARDSLGRTARDLAAWHRHSSVIAALEEATAGACNDGEPVLLAMDATQRS